MRAVIRISEKTLKNIQYELRVYCINFEVKLYTCLIRNNVKERIVLLRTLDKYYTRMSAVDGRCCRTIKGCEQ